MLALGGILLLIPWIQSSALYEDMMLTCCQMTPELPKEIASGTLDCMYGHVRREFT